VRVRLMKFSHGWMSDTHPDALRAFLNVQSGFSPEQKLSRVAELYDAMTALQNGGGAAFVSRGE
ncbi:MAG: hypothetical protein M3N93_12215, partial [Acidobacteriota bacterium]|nr:hypothetical protein [Acidobacteriota bacterium]